MSTERDGPTTPRLVAGLALTAAAAAASTLPSVLPRPGEPVAILAPFGTQASLITAIAEAGGALAGLRGDSVAVALPNRPDFISRLRSLGYWFVLDVRVVELCGLGPTPPGGAFGRQSD